MCQRCVLGRLPDGTLGIRNEKWSEDPNVLHQRMRSPCRHDKKRIVRAQRNTPGAKDLLGSQQQSFEMKPFALLLLEYGKEFPTEDFSKTWVAGGDHWGCFGNSYALASQESDFLYAEGVALPIVTGQGIMLHAWNIHASSGTVLDLTWPMNHLNRYFGVSFDLEWLRGNCKMPCGVFHPDNWPYNEVPVREYLAHQATP